MLISLSPVDRIAPGLVASADNVDLPSSFAENQNLKISRIIENSLIVSLDVQQLKNISGKGLDVFSRQNWILV